MKYLKHTKIFAFFCAIFLTLTTPAYAAGTKAANSLVEKNKIWFIRLNNEVSSQEALENVFVTDINGNKADANIIVSSDNSNILIIPPDDGYEPGQSYMIKINEDDRTDTTIKSFTIKKDELRAVDIAKKCDSIVKIEVYDKNKELLSTASGIIFNGKIITNYHVIDKASFGYIILNDGSRYSITGVYDCDKEKDLAVLQSDAKNFSSSILGNSDELSVGEYVVAIGSPKGLLNTVSCGIISGFRKNNGSSEIQISTPINCGSSGGALFNVYGEVVGITSEIMETTGDLNFAIPINQVKNLLNATDIKPLETVTGVNANNKISPPVFVSATAVSPNEIRLMWSKVEGADYYKAYYSPSYTGEFLELVNGSGLNKWNWYSDYSISIGGLHSNSTRYYKITSVKNGTESDFSIIVSATTPQNN